MKCDKRLALGLDFGPDFEGYNCKLLQFALQPDGMKRMPQVFSVPVDCQCQVKLFEATLPSQGRDFKLVNHLSLNCIHIHKYRYNYLYIYICMYIYIYACICCESSTVCAHTYIQVFPSTARETIAFIPSPGLRGGLRPGMSLLEVAAKEAF